MKVQESILKVLRLVDGDFQPKMEVVELPATYRFTCCITNPQYMYGENAVGNDQELLSGVKNVISKLERNLEVEVRALQQIYLCRDKMESFSTNSTQKTITFMDPVRVLSQTTSSSNCERNWSIWSLVHAKTRNRLKYKGSVKLSISDTT
ncbi:Collagen type IV alpha-3-binding protein [Bienertia sinuspersici]